MGQPTYTRSQQEPITVVTYGWAYVSPTEGLCSKQVMHACGRRFGLPELEVEKLIRQGAAGTSPPPYQDTPLSCSFPLNACATRRIPQSVCALEHGPRDGVSGSFGATFPISLWLSIVNCGPDESRLRKLQNHVDHSGRKVGQRAAADPSSIGILNSSHCCIPRMRPPRAGVALRTADQHNADYVPGEQHRGDRREIHDDIAAPIRVFTAKANPDVHRISFSIAWHARMGTVLRIGPAHHNISDVE